MSGDSPEHFSLWSATKDGRPHLLTFAELMLKYLQDVGLGELYLMRRGPNPDDNEETTLPSISKPGPYDPESYRVRLSNGQVVWLSFSGLFASGERTRHGYRGVSVLDRKAAEKALTGVRAEKAIVAATTIMSLEPIDVGKLQMALARIEGPLTKSARDHARETSDGMRDISDLFDNPHKWERENYQALKFQGDLQQYKFDYVLALLRDQRPDFDSYPRKKQVDLVYRTAEHVNSVLESARALMAFLEHGTRNGIATKLVKDVRRDVRAAVLSEVASLSDREIGKELDVPLPPQSKIKGGHDTVAKMRRRGLKILQDALGEDGWLKKAEAMKVEAARYNSLSYEEQEIERLAEAFGESIAEARERHSLLQQDELDDENL